MTKLVFNSICWLQNCRCISTIQKSLRNCSVPLPTPSFTLFLFCSNSWRPRSHRCFSFSSSFPAQSSCLILYQPADLVPCSAAQTVVPAQLKWSKRGASSQACCGSTGHLMSSSRVPGWLNRLVLKHPLPDTLCTPFAIGSITCFPKENAESAWAAT